MIFYIFIILFLIQCTIYTFFRYKIVRKTYLETKKKYIEIPISVIICAKNEEKFLKKYIPYIVNQNYKNFEIIVVNDASTDETNNVLNKFKNLTVINLAESFGKKNALEVGIKHAKYEHLLFTDADCKPFSKNWISLMANEFSEKKQIIVGYGGYFQTKNFLNNLICYDSYMIALQYFTAIEFGFPYMCVGRNMAYTKTLWKNVNGFENHKKIKSGDDDLFLKEAATKKNIATVLNKNSFTFSETKTSFNDFLKQKSRHTTTAKYYSFSGIFFSTFEILTRILFFILIILSIFFKHNIFIICILCILRFLYLYFITKKIRKIFNIKIGIINYLFLDFCYPFFYVLLFGFNFINTINKIVKFKK